MPRSPSTLGLILLWSVAFALRLGVVLAVATDEVLPVTYEHGEIAENLLAGKGFTVRFLGVTGPTSQQAPFYPLLLAAGYRLFGPGSAEAVLAVQLLQCVAGAALVVAVAWLAWALVPTRASLGWAAGWGAAVYPTHIYLATHLQASLWAALGLTLLAASVASPRGRGRWPKAIAVGGLAGSLLLIEPILALALPILAVAFWQGERGRGPHRPRLAAGPLGRVALASAVASLVVAPWLVRNYRVHGEFVFVKSSFGYAFWQGNNPASWGTDKVPKRSADALRRQHDGTLAGMDHALWDARHETLYIDDVILGPAAYRRMAGRSEPARSRLLGQEAWDFVSRNPLRYARLCGRRLRYFLLFDETNPKAGHPLYRMATVAWVALALVGVLVSRPYWKALWPTLAIFAVVTLFHALVIVSARFRIPIEPLSFVWCAAAVAPVIERLAPGLGRGRRAAPARRGQRRGRTGSERTGSPASTTSRCAAGIGW